MIKREDFTRGEWLYIHRRRNELSVAECAKTHGVGEDKYRLWERDRVPQDEIPKLKHTPTNVTYGEYSTIMRRRKGWSMTKVARMRKTTKMTIWKQEHDLTRTAPLLAAWWRRVHNNTLYFPSTP
jgi:hypothetical protein